MDVHLKRSILNVQVTLTKKSGGEEVMITLNVNHTVDSAAPDDGTGEVRQSLQIQWDIGGDTAQGLPGASRRGLGETSKVELT